MTVADTSLITPSNLGYFVLEASDLGAWREFAVGVIGMQEAPAANPDVLALRLDARAQRIVINQGAEDDMQAEAFRAAARAAGATVSEST